MLKNYLIWLKKEQKCSLLSPTIITDGPLNLLELSMRGMMQAMVFRPREKKKNGEEDTANNSLDTCHEKRGYPTPLWELGSGQQQF